MEQPTAIIEELGLRKYSGEQLTPWFTGWKDVNRPISEDRIVADDVPREYVGQIVQVLLGPTGKPDRMAVVVLPSMKEHIVKLGQTFEIGEERLSQDTTLESMRQLLVEGLSRLKLLVAAS